MKDDIALELFLNFVPRVESVGVLKVLVDFHEVRVELARKCDTMKYTFGRRVLELSAQKLEESKPEINFLGSYCTVDQS